MSPAARRSALARIVRVAWPATLVAVIVTAVFTLPLPFYVESPGSALDIATALDLDVDQPPLDGTYLLLSVRLSEGTPYLYVRSVLDEHVTRLPRELVVPPDVDDDAYFDSQREVFTDASAVAAAVGLRAAGYDVPLDGEGAAVVGVLPDSPADGALEAGDVVVALDGAEVRTVEDLIAGLNEVDAPTRRELRVERDGRTLQVRVEPAVLDDGTRQLGVQATTAGLQPELPLDVEVDGGRVGGPSGGLLLALAVYDRVEPLDLADGRRIAGTGTISVDGRVGRIGGIDAKAVTASAAGAEVFLAPASQAEEARAALPADSALEVVGVETFEEARAALAG